MGEDPSAARPKSETHAYSLDEIMTMIDALGDPFAATLIGTAAFTGARRRELRAMRWDGYRNQEIMVSSSIWHGIETDPKTEKSKAPIPVIPRLAKMLEAHRVRMGNPIGGPIFPNGNRKPICLDAVARRMIIPALNVCGVCSRTESDHGRIHDHKYQRNTALPRWFGWHGFRRGLGTVLTSMGVDDHTIQRILRHENVKTKQEIYIRNVTGAEKTAMAKLDDPLNDTYLTPNRMVKITKAVQ